MDSNTAEKPQERDHRKISYTMSILGGLLGIVMAVAIIYYGDWIYSFSRFGYIGAFLISLLGGSVWLVPVPMAAVVFAMGPVVEMAWLLALANGAGETIGAIIIYMTGHGAGTAIVMKTGNGRFHRLFNRLMGLVQRRGGITLFLLAAILNPFFYPAALTAGALHYDMKKYFIVTWIGKTIKGFTLVYLGYFGLGGILRLFGVDV
ncbi:VTT domain-containing protein [Chloroflexota bacterium]